MRAKIRQVDAALGAGVGLLSAVPQGSTAQEPIERVSVTHG